MAASSSRVPRRIFPLLCNWRGRSPWADVRGGIRNRWMGEEQMLKMSRNLVCLWIVCTWRNVEIFKEAKVHQQQITFSLLFEIMRFKLQLTCDGEEVFNTCGGCAPRFTGFEPVSDLAFQLRNSRKKKETHRQNTGKRTENEAGPAKGEQDKEITRHMGGRVRNRCGRIKNRWGRIRDRWGMTHRWCKTDNAGEKQKAGCSWMTGDSRFSLTFLFLRWNFSEKPIPAHFQLKVWENW